MAHSVMCILLDTTCRLFWSGMVNVYSMKMMFARSRVSIHEGWLVRRVYFNK